MKGVLGRKPNYDDKFESVFNGSVWSVPTIPAYVRLYLKGSANPNVHGNCQLYTTHYVKFYTRNDFNTSNEQNIASDPVNIEVHNEPA